MGREGWRGTEITNRRTDERREEEGASETARMRKEPIAATQERRGKAADDIANDNRRRGQTDTLSPSGDARTARQPHRH